MRHILRSLAHDRSFSLVVVGLLAPGAALVTVIIAVAYGVLLRPLPYDEPDRLVRLSEEHAGATSTLREPLLSDLTFAAWRNAARTLEGLAAYSERAYTVTGLGDAERARATAVSPEVFSLLRVRPAAGELLQPSHAVAGADSVVVLSHGYWRDRFGGDHGAIGRSLVLDGRPHIIIGVTPPGFSFPDPGRAFFTSFAPPQPDLNTPLQRRPTRVVAAIGRLARGVTITHAEDEGTTAARSTEPRPPSARLMFGEGGPVMVRVHRLADSATAQVRALLWMAAAGATIILLITSATIAGLSMVRGVAREHEFAIRAALGAGRAQALVRTAMEAGVLALAATMLGGAIAIVVIASLPAIVPTNFPRLDEVRIDPLVILPLAVSGIGGTLAIWLPAFRSAWRAHAAIVRGAWASTDSSHVARRYRMFAIAQTALAVVLMVAATLLTRSLVTLMRVDAGYSASNATTARITLHGSRDVPNRWRETATTIAARLNGVTGIEHVGASNMAPFGDTNHVIGFRITSQGGEPLIARALGYVVTPGYLEALRVTLREGRLFTPADLDGATQPIVINEAFARQYLQPSPVIGHQYFDTFAIDVTSEVIGVVGNVLKDGVDRPPQPELYVLAGHQGALATGRQINLVIRGTAGARSLAGPLRALTREVDRDAAVHNITSLQAQRSAAFAQPRLSVELSLTLALLALALAAAGLYGVLTYTVSRRRREWAIRAALGANRATLRAQALRHGLGSAGAGLLIGLLAAAAASRTLQSLLFGVPPFDVWSFFAAAVIVAAVAVAACLVPARRAAATDVASALRSE